VVPQKLIQFKGHLAFGGAFLALCIASTSLPGTSASGSAGTTATSTTVATVCSTNSCATTTLPSQTAGSVVAKTVTSPWGNPVAEDDFDSLSTSWDIYNDPDGDPRRNAANVSVSNGYVNVAGTYSGGVNVGSGLSEDFDQKFGRWEVRARSDTGAGFSPTILLWPKDNNWPRGGEIDLLESPHGNRQKGIAALHNSTQNNFKTHGLAGSQADWHIYAVDWLPNRITFYVDGVEQWTVTDSKLIPTTSAMHLVLQNDAGCGWVECPNASTRPVTDLQVDWVKVYALQHS
jgi:beta-glucanase (GH16 family)